MLKKITTLSAISLITATTSASAADSWKNTVSISGLGGNYYQSYKRNTYDGVGIKFSGDYLDQGGLTIGVKNSTIEFNLGYDDIQQNSLLLSGRYNFFPDVINGKLTASTDIHYIDNDDVTGDSDDVYAIAPQITYLPYSADYTLNLGVAYTKYQNELSVTQITPNVGFAFNGNKGWLNIGGYFISNDNANRAQGVDSTEAVEFSVSHAISKDIFLPINYVLGGLMLGERIYAVDNTSQSVYNVANVQKGSVSLGCSWDFGSNISLLTILGHEKFLDADINDEYSSNYVYLNLSKKW
ncbi:MAG: hypothetical protein D6B28_07625 [Gammaproteobacteria bacterium]|nr:MAG: hypothetical protein D6B28_07625 [Gammaproteobacteria bacterium]